jgi:phospholipase/lecithinase/hemolysin
VAILLALVPPTRAGLSGGIGVMGDSYCDEYEFYPPDRSRARNWVEILATTRGLNFGELTRQSRGEPRNQGYAYNWARSDATTETLLSSGQHTGLAAQVARGEVSLVYVFIGGNDFINAMYTADPLAALEKVLPRAMENYKVAVRTILKASPDVKLVLGTVPEIRALPEFANPIREGRISVAVADAFSAAQGRYNAQIRSLVAAEPKAALVDLDLSTRIADRLSPNRLVVAGRKLDRLQTANDLDHFFLADVRHPGTLGQGLMARMFVETINAKFHAGIRPLYDQEVLALAVAAMSPTRTLASAPRDPAVGVADFIAAPRLAPPSVTPAPRSDVPSERTRSGSGPAR